MIEGTRKEQSSEFPEKTLKLKRRAMWEMLREVKEPSNRALVTEVHWHQLPDDASSTWYDGFGTRFSPEHRILK